MTNSNRKPPTELEAEHVRWLWQGRLAFGKLTSMVGQEDRRKSFLCSTIAATTNTGGEWPGGGRSEPGHVVYLQAEDGFFDTTLPRLQAAGARVSNKKPVWSSKSKESAYLTTVPPRP